MKDLRPIKGRYHILRLIEEGEHVHQDFKFAISDARKIARSLSAFANAGGGHLLIGVKDNGVVAGIRSEEDIFVVEDAAERYCVPPQKIKVTAYKVGDGLTVVKAAVDEAATKPVRVIEGDGLLKSYFRVLDENIVAHPLMERCWAEGSKTVATLGNAERRILEILQPQPLTPTQIATRSHLSLATVADAVVALESVGLLKFVYSHGEWLIEASQIENQ